MTVYVDQLNRYNGGNRWCHMIADTVDELHAMAERIHMKREWFQGMPEHFPHYDLMPRRRHWAINFGAVELGNRDFVRKMQELRDGINKPR